MNTQISAVITKVWEKKENLIYCFVSMHYGTNKQDVTTWAELTWPRVMDFRDDGNKFSGIIKGRYFTHYLSNCWIANNKFDP